MAEATVVESMASETMKYYCHQCARPIELSGATEQLACPHCDSECIEEISPELEEMYESRNRDSMFPGPGANPLFLDSGGLFGGSGSSGRSSRGQPDLSSLFSNVLFNHNPVQARRNRSFGRSGSNRVVEEPARERSRFVCTNTDEIDLSDEDSDEGTAGLFGPRRYNDREEDESPSASGYSNSSTALPRFLEHLLEALTGGGMGMEGGAVGGSPPYPLLGGPLLNADPRDYAWGSDGLDNVITQLLNQLEGSGPAPASEDIISDLATVTVEQQHIDKSVECSVCMEAFVLDETVNSLPCSHLFHKDCIVPWLKLHGTCPVCRLSLAGEEPQESKASADTSAQPTTSLVNAASNGRPATPRHQLNLTSSSSNSSNNDGDGSSSNRSSPENSRDNKRCDNKKKEAEERQKFMSDFLQSTSRNKSRTGGRTSGRANRGREDDSDIFISLSSDTSDEEPRAAGSILWRNNPLVAGNWRTTASAGGERGAVGKQRGAVGKQRGSAHNDEEVRKSNDRRKVKGSAKGERDERRVKTRRHQEYSRDERLRYGGAASLNNVNPGDREWESEFLNDLIGSSLGGSGNGRGPNRSGCGNRRSSGEEVPEDTSSGNLHAASLSSSSSGSGAKRKKEQRTRADKEDKMECKAVASNGVKEGKKKTEREGKNSEERDIDESCSNSDFVLANSGDENTKL